MRTSVRVTRIIAAAAEDIFDAWTDPDQLRQWLYPHPGVVAQVSCSPVVGGTYRIIMISHDAATEITGEYLTVERPSTLIFTWRSNATDGRTTKVTVTLQPANGTGDQTEMTILHEQIPNQPTRHALHTGWTHATSKLAQLTTTNAECAQLPDQAGR